MKYSFCPEMYEHKWTEEEIADSIILKDFGFKAGDTVSCFNNTAKYGPCVFQHEKMILNQI